MKMYQHVLILLALTATVAKGITNYMQGYDWSWQFIALLWILSSYTGSIHNATLEKELRRYKG